MNFPNSISKFSFPCSGFRLEAVILPSSVSLRFRCRWPLLPAILNTILWFITFAADRLSSSSQIHTRLNLFEVNALSIAPSVRIFPPPGSACIYGAVGRRLPAIMAVSEALRLSAFDSQSAELSSAQLGRSRGAGGGAGAGRRDLSNPIRPSARSEFNYSCHGTYGYLAPSSRASRRALKIN